MDFVRVRELEARVQVGLGVVFVLDELESLHKVAGGAAASIDQLDVRVISGEREARFDSDPSHA